MLFNSLLETYCWTKKLVFESFCSFKSNFGFHVGQRCSAMKLKKAHMCHTILSCHVCHSLTSHFSSSKKVPWHFYITFWKSCCIYTLLFYEGSYEYRVYYCWNLKINLPINPNCSIVGLDLDIDGLIFFCLGLRISQTL